MHFLVAGLSYRTAPVEVLERVSATRAMLPGLLERLTLHAGEGVILSTCNRTEIYGIADDAIAGQARLLEFLGYLNRRGQGDAPPLDALTYSLSDDDAIRHLFSVTAGVDSMAIGEAQIAGQVAEALRAAGEARAVSHRLSRLFHHALRSARRIRDRTGIGRDRISIPSIGVQLIERTMGDLRGKSALLVGAGEMGALTARTLTRMGAQRLTVISRRPERARELAAELAGRAVAFEDLPAALAAADVIVTCTAATAPVITADMLRGAMSTRRDRPMMIVDMAMPRDVDHKAASIGGVSIYDLDRLQEIAAEHRANREAAAVEAQALISVEVQRFKERLTDPGAESAIRALGIHAEAVRLHELDRALRNLPGIKETDSSVIEAMSRSIVNRLLADPITFLRSNGDPESAAALLQAFDLEHDEDE